MKTQTILTLLLVFTIHFASGQLNCSKYYSFEEGASFQYSMFDKKGKADGTADYKVTKVEDSGSKTIAEMTIAYKDKKGKDVFSTNYNISCADQGIKIDFKSLMPTNMLEQYKDMEVDLTGTDIELPNDLSVGLNLEDANVTINLAMGGITMKTMVLMTQRKVEKQETITTPAGTYDCYVIYSENESQIMGIKKTFPSRLWLSEGVGMVKQETYQKDGDLLSATELTKFK
tara:strand:- start:34840 stop:35529 length:690 start_codon:yes stop_codon:yes gene_type:complete